MLKKITQKFIPESKGGTGKTANSHLEVSWNFTDTLEHAKIYNPSELNPETLSTLRHKSYKTPKNLVYAGSL